MLVRITPRRMYTRSAGNSPMRGEYTFHGSSTAARPAARSTLSMGGGYNYTRPTTSSSLDLATGRLLLRGGFHANGLTKTPRHGDQRLSLTHQEWNAVNRGTVNRATGETSSSRSLRDDIFRLRDEKEK